MKNLLISAFCVSAFLVAINQNMVAQQLQKTSTVPLDYGYGTADAPVVTIGSQVWLGKNLNVDRFANGDSIPEAKTEDEWKRAGENRQPAWCYYNNDAANGRIYGRLYNWYAVNDPRGLAPNGWHVPSDAEWDITIKHLAGNNAKVNKPTRMGNQIYYFTEDVGSLMKSTSGWKKNKGTNTSGITCLPGGNRLDYGSFGYVGEYGSWWSSSEDDTYKAWYRGLYFGNSKVNRFAFNNGCGFSVRCIKD